MQAIIQSKHGIDSYTYTSNSLNNRRLHNLGDFLSIFAQINKKQATTTLEMCQSKKSKSRKIDLSIMDWLVDNQSVYVVLFYRAYSLVDN